MNWDELVDAVAELDEPAYQRFVEAVDTRRTLGQPPGPGTDEPGSAVPSDLAAGPTVSENPDSTMPVGAETIAPQAQEPAIAPAPTDTSTANAPAATATVPAEVSRPGVGTPSAAGSFLSYSGPDTELTSLPRDSDVPTLSQIREKIEGRSARAEGQSVLDAESETGREQANREEDRAKAAQDVLDKIRASLHKK